MICFLFIQIMAWFGWKENKSSIVNDSGEKSNQIKMCIEININAHHKISHWAILPTWLYDCSNFSAPSFSGQLYRHNTSTGLHFPWSVVQRTMKGPMGPLNGPHMHPTYPSYSRSPTQGHGSHGRAMLIGYHNFQMINFWFWVAPSNGNAHFHLSIIGKQKTDDIYISGT